MDEYVLFWTVRVGREDRPSDFRVRIGGFNRRQSETERVTVGIERIFLHPDYSQPDSGSARNDIAVLRVGKSKLFNQKKHNY